MNIENMKLLLEKLKTIEPDRFNLQGKYILDQEQFWMEV